MLRGLLAIPEIGIGPVGLGLRLIKLFSFQFLELDFAVLLEDGKFVLARPLRFRPLGCNVRLPGTAPGLAVQLEGIGPLLGVTITWLFRMICVSLFGCHFPPDTRWRCFKLFGKGVPFTTSTSKKSAPWKPLRAGFK